MKLHIIFAQRVCSYDGQYTPEVIDCWDENTRDANPAGFDEAVSRAQAQMGADDIETVRVIDIEINGDAVARLLNEVPVLKGRIL